MTITNCHRGTDQLDTLHCLLQCQRIYIASLQQSHVRGRLDSTQMDKNMVFKLGVSGKEAIKRGCE